MRTRLPVAVWIAAVQHNSCNPPQIADRPPPVQTGDMFKTYVKVNSIVMALRALESYKRSSLVTLLPPLKPPPTLLAEY